MMETGALLRLMTWLSPAFPVGAFSYSHGRETVIRDGRIHDRETLCAWISGLVEHGSGWTDAVLLAAAWRSG
jgi:urease accessory protein